MSRVLPLCSAARHKFSFISLSSILEYHPRHHEQPLDLQEKVGESCSGHDMR